MEPTSEPTGERASNGAAQVLGIGQLGVAVADVAAMTAFYRDKVGLRFLFDAPGMSFFDVGGVRLMLSTPSPGDEARHGSILYLRVGDVSAAHDVLRRRGVEFRGAPHVVHRSATYELWMAFFADPEGNLLALMNERPLAG